MPEYPIDECPAVDCDRGPFDSEGSLRGHVNASGDPGHNWSEVQDQLGVGNSEGDDQAEAGDGAETDDQPEEGDNQAEAGDEQGDDQPEEGDEGDMPTQQEYEDQHATNGEQGKAGDGDSDGGTNDQGDSTSGSPLGALPMDPRTLGMLLAIALVLWLSYRALSGSSDEDQQPTSDEQAKAGDGSTAPDTEPAGGLMG